jgi:alanine dehydrogenase
MPGGAPRTSTFALNNATLPFIVELANKGYKKALLEDPHLRDGLNVFRGKITHPAVASALGLKFYSPLEVLD